MDQLSQDAMTLVFSHALPAARVIGILMFLPGLGGLNVPPQVRLVLAGGISFLAVGAFEPRQDLPSEPGMLIGTLLTELGLGLVVGWTVMVFLESIRWSGEILDMQLGLRAGQMFDPISAHGSTLLGQLYYLTALTFFFVIDGHHWVLGAIGKSFERIPVGQLAFGAPAMYLMLNAATSALDIAVRLVAPTLTALLLADLSLAVVGRHVPQMQVFIVGIPAKLAAGIAVLAFSAPLSADVLASMVHQIKQHIALLLTGG